MNDIAIKYDALIDLETAVTPERVAHVLAVIEDLSNALKSWRTSFEESMAAHVREHGPIEVGADLYVLSPTKSTKCIDLPGAVEAVLTAVGGDFGTFCQILSAGALKYGAARQVLSPDDFARFFRVEVGEELKVKAIPTRLIEQAK